MKAGLRGVSLALAAAILLSAPASADIKSFNAAMQAGNFKLAASEAASTWPTLDKTRDDLAIIAREFGFAAYMSGDFAAARTFATEALKESGDTPLVAASRVQSAVLLRAAEHRSGATDQTRDALVQALQARATLPGLDGISFLAAQAAVNYDFGKARWAPAHESSGVAKTLTEAGGPAYRVPALRFEMVQAAASHVLSDGPAGRDRLSALLETVTTEINAAASDAAAQSLVALYWEVSAWATATSDDRRGRVSMGNKPPAVAAPAGAVEEVTRAMRLLATDPIPACKVRPDFDQLPRMPEFKADNKFNGVILVRVDIDDKGAMTNVKALASAPDPALGPALVAYFAKARRNFIVPGEPWGPSCSVARVGYTFTWIFDTNRF